MVRFLLGLSLALCAVGCWAADLKVDLATYLGGASMAEEWVAVDIAPDGTVVVAGMTSDGSFPGAKTMELMGGGYGVVLRIDPKTQKPISVTRLGDTIDDMQVGEDGNIAVTGSFGVALLSADGSKLLWRDGMISHGTRTAAFRNQTPPFRNDRYTRRVSRVAVGTDGTVSSLQNDEKAYSGDMKGHLYVWDKDGKRLADIALLKYKYPEDVCVSAKDGLVIVGGWNTYSADSKYMKDHPIHMPWIAAYTYAGERKWEDYNFSAADIYAENSFADSRVQRLTIGRDGMMYMGGYIHGGDYVWAHDPHDLKKRVNVNGGYDSFSTASNMGRGIDQAYYAKYDPATGDILRGQVLLTRQQAGGGGKPAQIQIRGIDADEKGNVYMSGYCEAFIKDRAAQKINGVEVGEYYKPEPFVIAVPADFGPRKTWTVFAKHGEAAFWGMAIRNGYAAMVGELYEGEMITSENAWQKTPAGPTDGYLVLWNTNPPPPPVAPVVEGRPVEAVGNDAGAK